VTFGGNAYRVYFFELTGVLIVALCGAQKKNDKDQKREIQTAAQYMQDAKERANEVT
jgi:putative component of toxin-antitoxin plasmid stabilization module